ncbi:MAG TPA: sodium:calcium antiporter [Alphaproteobacteria bacterium]|nr:sodium:calcium antiporter [Alphaproteobacteria bacterium]
MAITFLLFLGSAVVIYLACEFFVNGVEWVGQRTNVSQNATGTILAAFGTALPESVVTFTAVVFGTSSAERDIGVGAAVGGPLVLSTIAYAVVGLTLFGTARRSLGRSRMIDTDGRRLARDQGWFLLIFLAAFVLGLTSFPGKSWLALLFVAAYGLYAARELSQDADLDIALEPLKLRPHDEQPSLFWATLQTFIALLVIFVASRVFVAQLGRIGPWLGLPPQLTSLLLSPVATEMPETMNAVIWVRQGKERLALANISGAMMIQATIPAALGIGFTPWRFDQPLVVASAITILAVITLRRLFRTQVSGLRLAPIGLWYLIFASVLLFV